MLEPQSRVVLLDQLRPPAGFSLDAAVATTFTLDLRAALVPPLAFASFGLNARTEPLAVMEAVRACTQKVDIFCQAGQILIPKTATDLMAFLEPMVHPVVGPTGGLFHPKIWFLRYLSAEGEAAYRLLCSSRNLVESDAWDLTVTMDGRLGRRDKANKPLSSLIRSLAQMTVSARNGRPLPAARIDRISSLADDAMRVQWEEVEGTDEHKFLGFGIPRLPRPDLHLPGTRSLVISPFADEDALSTLTCGTRDVVVISRPETFDAMDAGKLSMKTLDGVAASSVLDPMAGLSGTEEDPEPGTGAASSIDQADLDAARNRSGLHAKLLLRESEWKAHLIVGSVNATTAALERNVEFAVELIGPSARIGRAKILGSAAPSSPEGGGVQEPASSGLAPFLQPYDPNARPAEIPDDSAERELARVLRNVAAVQLTAKVVGPPTAYAVQLSAARDLPLKAGYSATVALLTRPADVRACGTRDDMATFARVPLADITPFVSVVIEGPTGLTRGTIVHAELINDPEGRLDEVLARQINDSNDFMRFLQLLLSLGGDDLPWLGADTSELSNNGSSRVAFSTAGVMESMVAALARNTEGLDAIGSLVEHLRLTERGRAIIPEGFDALWDSISQARAKWGQQT